MVTFPTASMNQTSTRTSASATGTGTISTTATITGSSSSTTSTSASLPSQFSFLTASHLAMDSSTSSSMTSSTPVTQTDPDAVMTTSSAASTFTGIPVFPTALPTRIVPLVGGVDPVRDANALQGYTLVGVLFTTALNWAFVAKSQEAIGQMFLYGPQMISTGLGIPGDQVKTFALQAYTTKDFNGDPSQIRTLFLCYIPKDQVDDLAAQLRTKQSDFYTKQTNSISAQLVALVDPTLPPTAIGTGNSGTTGPGSGSNGPDGSSAESMGATGTDHSRRDAIIGVCVAFAVLLLAVAGWYAVRNAKRRREERHHPINPSYERTGMQSPSDQMSERPRSFFFAEDSLRGYQAGAHAVSDEYNYRQAPSHRRVPVQTSAISAPVLRESSLNW
ncbi:hypothetical protein FRC09_008003 [Ceratobasidium sp. 395]|nr:hypothetical protein FRC09_008003 [Ceratobasidium sp. 395]